MRGRTKQPWVETSPTLLVDNYKNILDIGFFSFPEEFYGEVNCCDQAFYFITINNGDQTHSTQWHDFADPSEEALQVKTWMDEIIDIAISE